MTDDNKKRGPGRPTEKRKDTILRLRIDTDTHRKLSECAAVRQVSMSELVREAIDEIFRREKEKQQKNPKKRMQMLTGVIYLVIIGIAGIAAWMELLTVTQAGGITCLITAILAYTLSSEKTGKKKDEQKKNSGVKWELPEVSEERFRQDTEKIPDQMSEEEVGATTLLWKGEEEYKPQLTLISMNPRERNSVVLVKDNYVIGKLKSKADILLEEEGISRVHARIQKEGEEYYLYDMNSTNGTFINGRRLGVNEKVPLHVTDEIAFAKIEYYIGNC